LGVIVLVLLVRDEEDVVGDTVAYHLAAGVDHVIATDHRSRDGTTEILRGLERDGVLTYVREDRPTISQCAVMTAMARRAAVELGADWVIAADADEIWWCREGRLPDVLETIPARYGAFRAPWRHFVLRPDDEQAWHRRMTLRCRPAADPDAVYHRHYKTLFRGSPIVELDDGNHNASGVPGSLLRGWHPVEVLHFPLRNGAQVRSKFGARLDGLEVLGRHQHAARRYPGGIDAFVRDACPTGAALEQGLGSGQLVEDLRVRDAIDAVRAGRPLQHRLPTLAEDVDFARDVDSTLELDVEVARRARAEALQRSLARR
jgi:hypothetical protein